MHRNCVSFLKIYLFITPTCFGYSLATIRVLLIWYSGRTMFSATQEISRILCNPKVHYRIHNSPPSVPIVNQIDLVHAFQS